MNIFLLHEDPRRCAEMHCDSHVIKMITGYSQLLSTTFKSVHPTAHFPEFFYDKIAEDKQVVKWLNASISHRSYLICLLRYLIKEYDYRYGKADKFLRARRILQFIHSWGKLDMIDWSTAPQYMPDKYRVQGDPITAYRKYYKGEKKFAQWTKRPEPVWLRKLILC